MTHHRTEAAAVPENLPGSSEDGFLLLGAIVAIALVLLALSIAATRVARELRREREEEAVHRGNQYVRAIQLYYRRFGHYPGSIDQLMNTNNIRFLRQRYADPITGKDDFRLIPVGQNKTTVKTFFGKPIGGISTAGVGSVSSMISPGAGTASPGAVGGPAGMTSSSGFGTPASNVAGASAPAGAEAATGSSGASGTSGATGTTGAPGSTGETSALSGLAQPFMGVGLNTKGDSIVQPNEQKTYETWEFLYDPRLDQLKARAAALNGGGLGSVPANSLGQTGAFGATGSTGATGSSATASPAGSNSASPSTPTAPAGTQP